MSLTLTFLSGEGRVGSRYLFAIVLFSVVSVFSLSAKQDEFRWLRECRQQTVRDYSSGLSAYYENGLWGFISLEGSVAIRPAYDEVSDFDGSFARVQKNGKWGVIDKSGQLLFNCDYDSITAFNDGVALAVSGAHKTYLYTDGTKKDLPASYDFHAFSDGYARIKDVKNGKWGYVDQKGVIRIDPKYDSATDFKTGHAVVTLKDKTYSLNKSGDRKQVDLYVNGNEVSVLSNGAGFIKNSDGTLSFFTSSHQLASGRYREINDFSDGLARAKDMGDNVVYLDAEGNTVLSLKGYADAGDFNEGKAWVRTGARYGFVNKSGKLVIDTLFTYASDFNDELAYVATGQRQGVIKVSTANDRHPVLDVADIVLNDKNGNGMVEADESFEISFVVRNIGDEVINEAVVTMGLNTEQMEWFSYDNTKFEVGTLKPGEERKLSLTGSANTGVISEGIDITFKGEADNLFSFPMFPYTFKALGINACKPVIETFWVYNEDHTPLTAGREAVLKMTVKNTGADMAKDVSVSLNWPEGILYRDKDFSIPSLAPGETKEVVTTFTVYNDNASKDFSMVAMVDEFTHKRNDVKYLSFSTGKHNAMTNLLSGVTAAEAAYPSPSARKETRSELLIDLTPAKEFAKNRYALVIGNEDYNSMKQGSTYQPDVDYAVRDAETFAEYATNMMGVRKDNVILVKNATLAQMKVSLDKLTKLARANHDDLELIVYYAGHGQVDGDSKESYLIPVDVSITSPTAGMKLEDFYATLNSCNADRTFVFLDACYSGVGRGVIIKPKEAVVKGNLVVMTATSSTQRSMPYQEKNHGLFTYYLLKALKDGGGNMSIGELYDQVSETVKTKSILINNAEQTPELLNGYGISSDWRNWSF